MAPNRNASDIIATASPRYRAFIAGAGLLFLILITITAVMIIITGARQDQLQEEFDMTLTAIFAPILEQAAQFITPTPAPLPILGDYDFVAGDVAYAAVQPCDHHLLTGTVRAANGDPRSDLRVWVWGDYLPPQTVYVGRAAGLPDDTWSLALEGMINRRVYVQLAAAERYLAAPVEIILDATNCDSNHASIIFEEIEP